MTDDQRRGWRNRSPVLVAMRNVSCRDKPPKRKGPHNEKWTVLELAAMQQLKKDPKQFLEDLYQLELQYARQWRAYRARPKKQSIMEKEKAMLDAQKKWEQRFAWD